MHKLYLVLVHFLGLLQFGFPDNGEFFAGDNGENRRSSPPLRGHNSNENSRYIELVLVLDRGMIRYAERKSIEVEGYSKNLTSLVNHLMNIYVALVGIVRWDQAMPSGCQPSPVTQDANHTLVRFGYFRRDCLMKADVRHDVAVLLTTQRFEGGEETIGKAFVEAICLTHLSIAVVTMHSKVIAEVAGTLAHELGHVLGLNHDKEECRRSCPDCIMSPTATSEFSAQWSSCSRSSLRDGWRLRKSDYCLRNKPKKLYGSPTCGNGFVEPGEECDCGLSDYCRNKCCDPLQCKLRKGAACADGECCDLKTCSVHKKDMLCRRAVGECGVAEFCDGESSDCPKDEFKPNGIPCKGGRAYCYLGKCNTHDDQCALLWGAGSRSTGICYKLNVQFHPTTGHCDWKRGAKEPIKCAEKDKMCGVVQCDRTAQNESTMYALTTKKYSRPLPDGRWSQTQSCFTAWLDIGTHEIQPAYVPNGASCGINMTCLNQKCINITDEAFQRIPSEDEYQPPHDHGYSTTWIIVALVLLLICAAVIIFLSWRGHINLFERGRIVTTAATRVFKKPQKIFRKSGKEINSPPRLMPHIVSPAHSYENTTVIQTRDGEKNIILTKPDSVRPAPPRPPKKRTPGVCISPNVSPVTTDSLRRAAPHIPVPQNTHMNTSPVSQTRYDTKKMLLLTNPVSSSPFLTQKQKPEACISPIITPEASKKPPGPLPR